MARAPNRNPKMAAALARERLTLQSLADRTGLHPVTLSRVYNQRQHLSRQSADRVASVLNTTAEALGLVGEGGAA